MEKTVSFKLNGRPVSLRVEGSRNLLRVLRNDLGLTGTKYGCGENYCGSCTVVVDNEAVRSCNYPVEDVEGRDVLTVEGLAADGNLHPLQQAFMDHDALQCGYCTPGMIMSAYALLLSNPRPGREEIIESMDNNLCRCGAHKRIIEAVQTASRAMEAR